MYFAFIFPEFIMTSSSEKCASTILFKKFKLPGESSDIVIYLFNYDSS